MTRAAIQEDAFVVREWALDAYVVGACWSRDGAHAAFGLGDGTVHLVAAAAGPAADPVAVRLAQGQVLCIVPDAAADAFLCSTDDGRVCSVSAARPPELRMAHPGAWLDALATHPAGARAAAAGNVVHLLAGEGNACKLGPHPSTVAGIAFRSDGRQLAAAHYEAVSLWGLDGKTAGPRRLEFPGSHLLVSYSPDGRFVATGTQEKEVHVWRTADGSDLRMSGYYAKVRALSWSGDSRWLLTSGADTAIAWRFDGDGPEGKPPRMLGPDTSSHVTQVACHPSLPVVAIGYADGALALARIGKPAREVALRAGDGTAITAMAFSPDGGRLAVGGRGGVALVYEWAEAQ